MTFSKALDSDTFRCDHCGRPVGNTWRKRAQHVCARVIDAAKRTNGPAS